MYIEWGEKRTHSYTERENRRTLEKSDAQSCLGGIRYNRAQWNQAESYREKSDKTERENSRDKWVKTWREKASHILERFIDA